MPVVAVVPLIFRPDEMVADVPDPFKVNKPHAFAIDVFRTRLKLTAVEVSDISIEPLAVIAAALDDGPLATIAAPLDAVADIAAPLPVLAEVTVACDAALLKLATVKLEEEASRARPLLPSRIKALPLPVFSTEAECRLLEEVATKEGSPVVVIPSPTPDEFVITAPGEVVAAVIFRAVPDDVFRVTASFILECVTTIDFVEKLELIFIAAPVPEDLLKVWIPVQVNDSLVKFFK